MPSQFGKATKQSTIMTWVEFTSFNEVIKELFVLPLLRYQVPYLWALSLTLPCSLKLLDFYTLQFFEKQQ